jgi:RNA methyltransferase, TrmH family
VRIASTRNSLVKYVRSLQRTSVRRSEGVYLAEGVRLVADALSARQYPTVILYDPSLLQRTEEGSSLYARIAECGDVAHEVDEHVVRAVADTETPAGVVAVFRRPEDVALSVVTSARFGVILDGVSDPGNVGTIMRTAAATGCEYLAAGPGTADLFGPKVVRAGMGAHFRLPTLEFGEWDAVAHALSRTAVVGCSMSGEVSVFQVVWPERTAVVIGSEAHGLSAEARAMVGVTIRIPMRGGVESLNASVAAGVVLYEALGRSLDG